MLFPNPSLWPQFVPNSGEQDASTDPWGFGTVIETQARLWNHLLDANRSVMERYARKYRVGRVEGLHHYLFTQDSIKVVGTLWMRYIEAGFFD